MEEGHESLWEDGDIGEVRIRDQWQVELKSDFFPPSDFPCNQYNQEFYFFIPNSLQINSNTYSKEQFYSDQTTLIRYKTPEFTFSQLLDPNSVRSPLKRLESFSSTAPATADRQQVSDELKLLANVVRSTMRTEVKKLTTKLNFPFTTLHSTNLNHSIQMLCDQVRQLKEVFSSLKKAFLNSWKDTVLLQEMEYIDEFMSNVISYYLTHLVEAIRQKNSSEFAHIDKMLCDLLIQENQIPSELFPHHPFSNQQTLEDKKENYVYRLSLLNKFILEPLQLQTNRFSLDQRYQHWIGSFSAGIAMTLYFSLFVWLGGGFFVNSVPFIILMVAIYVLKDRIKEWLRAYSYQNASRWFPDYTTTISSFNKKKNLGIIKDSFSFIDPEQLSPELKASRNAHFHTVLEHVQRPETILFYKRLIKMSAPSAPHARRSGLKIIFRFNIQRFLYKSSDAIETINALDPKSCQLEKLQMPKIYHLNLLIRSTTVPAGKEAKVEYKKLRIIADKNGIKRIDQIL